MQPKVATDINRLRIGVVGAGSWGTALANLLAAKGFAIDLWVFEKEVKDQIQQSGENAVFLPGFKLSSNLNPTNDLAEAVSAKDIVLVVVPSHIVRSTTANMAGHLGKDTILVAASKGI